MKSEDRSEVFRGHLDECLKHFGSILSSRIPRGSRGASQQIKPLADFCGVNISTARNWIHAQVRLPVGIALIKLMCYLDLLGYKIIEFEKLSKGKRGFTELVGFEIFTLKQATEFLDYKQSYRMYDVLFGRRGVGNDKDRKMWDAWKERREELERKKQSILEASGSQFEMVLKPISPKSGKSIMTSPVSRKKASDINLRVALKIMAGLLLLMEELQLDDLEEDKITEFFRTEAKLIFRLSAKLSVLSSRLATTKSTENET